VASAALFVSDNEGSALAAIIYGSVGTTMLYVGGLPFLWTSSAQLARRLRQNDLRVSRVALWGSAGALALGVSSLAVRSQLPRFSPWEDPLLYAAGASLVVAPVLALTQAGVNERAIRRESGGLAVLPMWMPEGGGLLVLRSF
jgi:hypothetical protein